jgi:hypothetical protein
VRRPHRQRAGTREHERAGSDKRHVLARDREQVVEARRTEALAELVGKPFVLAEDNTLHNAPPLAAKVLADPCGEPAVKRVPDAGRSAAPADTTPPIRAQHDVHATSTQPRSFVETVVALARPCERPDELESSPERRRASERQLQQNGLVRCEAPEAEGSREHADVEAAPARRSDDFDDCAIGSSDTAGKR